MGAYAINIDVLFLNLFAYFFFHQKYEHRAIVSINYMLKHIDLDARSCLCLG